MKNHRSEDRVRNVTRGRLRFMRAKALRAVHLTDIVLESSFEMGTVDSENSSGSDSTEEPDCSILEDLVAALELLKIDVCTALDEAKADLEDCLQGG